MSKFAYCKEAAITASGAISDSIIAYGLYIATTPKEKWADGWSKEVEYPVFTHFWVESKEKIIDTALEQYGGPAKLETKKDDPHYVKVGIYDKFTDTAHPLVQNPKIRWDTWSGKPGGVVVVEWPDVDTYLRERL